MNYLKISKFFKKKHFIHSNCNYYHCMKLFLALMYICHINIGWLRMNLGKIPKNKNRKVVHSIHSKKMLNESRLLFREHYIHTGRRGEKEARVFLWTKKTCGKDVALGLLEKASYQKGGALSRRRLEVPLAAEAENGMRSN